MTVIRPHPGKQTVFLTRTEHEVLFGGQVGPGKTWALVIDALGLQYIHTPLGIAAVEVPEYRAVLFRRTSNQLDDLIDECKKYYCHYPFNARFVLGRKGEPGPSFTFPSGAKIYCCHLQLEKHKESHDGFEYAYEGWDELTHFTYTMYTYLFSRSRTKIQKELPGGKTWKMQPRIRCTTMWKGIGLKWVRDRFYANMEPVHTYWFVADPKRQENYQGIKVAEGTPYARSRCFIPGNIYENKTLNVEEYISSVKAMGARYEQALLKGDPYAFAGDFFPFDAATMVIDPFKIPKEWRLIMGLDPGWGGVCSASIRAIDLEDNHYRCGTYYARGRMPHKNAEGLKEFIQTFPFTQDSSITTMPKGWRGRFPSIIAAGKDSWAHKDRAAILASEMTFADVLLAAGLVLTPAVTDRHNGWGAVKDLMEQGRWKVFDIFNEPFIDEVTAAVADENDEEDIQGCGNDPDVPDHALDDERYATMSSYTPKDPGGKNKPTGRAYASSKKKRKSVYSKF